MSWPRTKRLLLALALVAWASSAHAAIAVLDSQQTTGSVTAFPTGGGTGNTLRLNSVTSSAGSNRFRLISVMWQNTLIASAINSVTYGGQTITSTAIDSIRTTGGIGVRMYYCNETCIAALSGSTIEVTWNDTPDRALVVSFSYSGVSGLTNATGATGNTGTTATLAPTSTTGDLVFACEISSDTGQTLTTGTSVYALNSGHGYGCASAAGATPTMTYTFGSGENYGITGANLTAAGGGGGSATPTGMMTGVLP